VIYSTALLARGIEKTAANVMDSLVTIEAILLDQILNEYKN